MNSNLLAACCRSVNASNNRGVLLMQQGSITEAMCMFRSALQELRHGLFLADAEEQGESRHLRPSPRSVNLADSKQATSMGTDLDENFIQGNAKRIVFSSTVLPFPGATHNGDTTSLSCSAGYAEQPDSKGDGQNFVLFDRAMSLSSSEEFFDQNTETSSMLLSCVILFNIGLAHHIRGLGCGTSGEPQDVGKKNKAFPTAFKMYSMSRGALLQRTNTVDYSGNLCWTSVAVLMLALTNNIGHLHVQCGRVQDATLSKAELTFRLVRLLMPTFPGDIYISSLISNVITGEELKTFFASTSALGQESQGEENTNSKAAAAA